MKSKIKWLIALIILVLLAGLYSVVDKKTPIYDTEIDNSEYFSVDLREGDRISQSFLAPEDTLDGVMIKMAAVGNLEGTILEYNLLESGGETVLEGETSLGELTSGRFFQIDFDQLTGCENQIYELQILVKECDENSSITLYYTGGKQQNTECMIGDTAVDGTLVLRTFTHRFDLETFVVTVCFLIYVILFMRWLSKLFK
ncbi:hypothetical protein [Claveliimonas bilis]|uniref:hypothetical protein n=1 Tax=Clostridia TaxID=186801 RepID=UPI001E5F4EBD|nr:hypothetical protein [Claveliimonas bilis]MCQ5202618.1 hypothetical protein [Mordavella massiliensis]BCZ26284.1 hypothetical protein EUBC25_03710 [Claveliimonas bilis]